jgi:integrase
MLTREWIEARRPAWSPRYARLIEGRLKSDILPIIGDKPIRSILPRTMLEALRVIEARGSYEMTQPCDALSQGRGRHVPKTATDRGPLHGVA